MVGKRVRNALYVHRAAIDELRPEQRARLDQALSRARDTSWNVARIEPLVVALLEYEPFDATAFPTLLASTRVDLASGVVTGRSYAGSENPLVLHRKEQLAPRDHPDQAVWSALTRELERLDCFREPHLIGRRRAWEARLAAAGVRIEGHLLCQI